MHGVILKGLKDHVSAEYGAETWSEVIEQADIEPKLYLPVTTYPDEEWVELIETTVDVVGVDRETLLGDVGGTVGPAMLETFRAHVRDDWDGMDAIEHLDSLFEELSDSGDETAPRVVTKRSGPDTVALSYQSDHADPALVSGLLRGIGDQYGESVTVEEHESAPGGCQFRVSR